MDSSIQLQNQNFNSWVPSYSHPTDTNAPLSLNSVTGHLMDVFNYYNGIGLDDHNAPPCIDQNAYHYVQNNIDFLLYQHNDKKFFDYYTELLWEGADQLTDLFSEVDKFSQKYLSGFENNSVHNVPEAGCYAEQTQLGEYFDMKRLHKKRKRANLPKQATRILEQWILMNINHPYPSEDEKKHLCKITFLSAQQLSNWFINARRRILPKLKLKYGFSTI